MVAMLPSSTITQQPISPWIHGSIPISNLTSSPSFKSRRLTLLNSQFRAALVEAKPSSQSSVSLSASPKDDTLKALALSKDRAEDIQAEAKALARAVNASVYSPQLVASRYGSKPLKVAGRAFQIVFNLGSFGLKLLWEQRNGVADQNKRIRAIELRNIFTKLGPTFVKLGQGLSTRPDICPSEYLEELSELQDGLPTFPDEDAFECIERELGLSLDSIFSTISPSPIAAASLGQVYKARLKRSGKVVAVKVQRPGIEEAIGLDFYLIRGLGFLINKYVDRITTDVVALIDEFACRVFQELNYVQEGQNARRFKKLYADKEDILVPDVFWDYTSAKVLTIDWIEGVKLNDQEAIERQGLNVLDLVNSGIQCSLRQLLEYGYFHADPHPGNLLATPEGKLAFLDFGMMSETPEEARFAIIGHVVHLVNRDYEAMAQDYYALDFLSRDIDVSPIVPALRNFFDDALNYTVSELNFKTIVDGLGNVLYEYPFNVPAYYALILRSLTVLEGLALYADPNFKVLAASYPYFAKRLLTDPNPYLRDALIELLFKDGKFRWNRLENLLVQGKKDRDFSAKEALQPVLKVLLSPDGEVLRNLVIKEAIRVSEAFTLGTISETYRYVPDFLRNLVFNGNAKDPLMMSETERQSIVELRDQVIRIWRILQSSNDFDPSLLLPILQVLQQPEARRLGGRVVGGITQRLAARFLMQLLGAPKTTST
ncbi:putative cadmium-transporting ATPase [Medicago truncatula]|uniref:Putative cadmium-transporting ATPase n=2 Tax=Medicago truncatula TaxID=3880 RepID=G7JFX0_MEDTR|nr:protein ACTIVITY OF BC1 COMPLEX KINASE 3, chloroplastic [Medicago truncatula]XP_024638486.1 protein ACTIVITY OF BC1 COMPLEX KINASE 3, chloroplastic [Medicago truncatula]XP_039689196.1 protein ACTIVITY OF BC1 COMPLEX KINASE 3, chloroplastic [Medicago truncatula]AES87391.1 ubiquinone biosynthesis protein UbiB [Medicago truncatula]RHN59328.1 putative cadmium-transporting ATPase [Medicago truncatula]